MKQAFLGVLSAGLLVLPLAPAKAAVTLDLTPLAQTESSLSLAITVAGLGTAQAPSIGAYDVSVNFDAQHLAWSGTDFGDPVLGDQLDMAGLGLNEKFSSLSAAGELNIFEVSFDSVSDLNDRQPDSFLLAVVNFDFLTNGASRLDMAVNSLADAEGLELLASSSTMAVSNVPLPAAGWLMLVALGGLTRMRVGSKHQASLSNHR